MHFFYINFLLKTLPQKYIFDKSNLLINLRLIFFYECCLILKKIFQCKINKYIFTYVKENYYVRGKFKNVRCEIL